SSGTSSVGNPSHLALALGSRRPNQGRLGSNGETLTATDLGCLPFYYEKDQRWCYQPSKYIQKVDAMDLRARLKMKYDEVLAGRQAAPLLMLSDLTCKVEKFYPVTDGEGGYGEVFSTNAAAG
ncbi:hypothetical protein CYMTET_34327, partial [Cymbomonas tetramitiformis]